MRRSLLAVLAVAGCAAPAAPPGISPPAEPAAITTPAPAAVRMPTHCGLEWAVIDGQTWRAVTAHPEPVDLARPDGTVQVDGYTSGTWTVLGDNLARFDVTDPYAAAVPGGVEFIPTAEPRPECA